MKKSKNAPVNRRSFLTGAVTGVAALVTKPAITAAAPLQDRNDSAAGTRRPGSRHGTSK